MITVLLKHQKNLMNRFLSIEHQFNSTGSSTWKRSLDCNFSALLLTQTPDPASFSSNPRNQLSLVSRHGESLFSQIVGFFFQLSIFLLHVTGHISLTTVIAVKIMETVGFVLRFHTISLCIKDGACAKAAEKPNRSQKMCTCFLYKFISL